LCVLFLILASVSREITFESFIKKGKFEIDPKLNDLQPFDFYKIFFLEDI